MPEEPERRPPVEKEAPRLEAPVKEPVPEVVPEKAPTTVEAPKPKPDPTPVRPRAQPVRPPRTFQRVAPKRLGVR